MQIPVRVIEYRLANRESNEVIRLVTTLTDHDDCPAAELAALYAERWDFEIGLDEIETHQIANNRVLRSKKPALVEQEIWGLLLTHYAIRHLMHEAADDIGIDEDRLSFIRSLRVVRRSIVNDSDFPPHQTDEVHRKALTEIARRPNPVRGLRGYPRVVKRTQVGDKLIKRDRRREIKYSESPKIKLEYLVA